MIYIACLDPLLSCQNKFWHVEACFYTELILTLQSIIQRFSMMHLISCIWFYSLNRLLLLGLVFLGSFFISSSSGPYSSPHGKGSYLQCFSCFSLHSLWKSSFIRLKQSVLSPPIYLYKTPWSRSFFRHESHLSISLIFLVWKCRVC